MSTAGQSRKSGLGANSWKKSASPHTWRRDGSTALLKQCGESRGIVWIGGTSKEEETSKRVELFERRLGKWWTLPSLREARAASAAVCVRGTVIVVGGFQLTANGEYAAVLGSGESFEFGNAHEWQPLSSSMITPRFHCASVALTRPEEVVMVVGGRDQHWNELRSVEYYSVSTKQWKTLPTMKTPRLAPAAVAIGMSRIMVMGGYDGQKRLNTVEAYDFNDGEWTELPPMPLPCAFASAVSVVQEGRFVLVFGGVQDGDKEVVQLYSVRERAWRLMEKSCPPTSEDCIVTAVDQNLLLISQDRQDGIFGNETMSCALNGISIHELWDDSTSQCTLSRATLEETREEQKWQTQGQTPRMAIAHASTALTESVRRLPIATSVVAVPIQGGSDPDSRGQEDDATKSVENMLIIDNSGRDAWYTGEISVRTERPHGKGRMVLDYEGETYDGDWKQGLRCGFGRVSYPNGDSFEGFFDRDKKSGRGSYEYRDGRLYNGKFRDNQCEDMNGVMTWKDGARYEGSFVNGKRSGRGRMTFPSGVTYEGQFENNKYNGFGTCRYADGRVYVGKFKRGKAHGRGRLTDKNETVLYEGLWANDEPA